jgi:hypothetical protein
MFPVLALTGTVAVSLLVETPVNVANVPLKATAVVPVRFAPLIVTAVPAGPALGVKPVMVGAIVKAPALVAAPTAVVTLIGPVVALAGTVAVIWVLEFTV